MRRISDLGPPDIGNGRRWEIGRKLVYPIDALGKNRDEDWAVVGIRWSGERFVLHQCPDRESAVKDALTLAQQLEGYEWLVAEYLIHPSRGNQLRSVGDLAAAGEPLRVRCVHG